MIRKEPEKEAEQKKPLEIMVEMDYDEYRENRNRPGGEK